MSRRFTSARERLEERRRERECQKLTSGKKLTVEEMHQNSERLYYNPLRNSSSKQDVSPKPGKKMNIKQQHYNIERMYYQATDFKQAAKDNAAEKMEEEQKRESIHQSKISVGEQLDLADRLYYQPMSSIHSPEQTPPKSRSPRVMNREDWYTTVDRLYEPRAQLYHSVFTQRRSSTPAAIKKAWRM